MAQHYVRVFLKNGVVSHFIPVPAAHDRHPAMCGTDPRSVADYWRGMGSGEEWDCAWGLPTCRRCGDVIIAKMCS